MSVPANSPVLAALGGGSAPAAPGSPVALQAPAMPAANVAAAVPAAVTAPFAALLGHAMAAAPKGPEKSIAASTPVLVAAAPIATAQLGSAAPIAMPTQAESPELGLDDTDDADDGDETAGTLLGLPHAACASPMRAEALAAALTAASEKAVAASGKTPGPNAHALQALTEEPAAGEPAPSALHAPASQRDVALAAALLATHHTVGENPLEPAPAPAPAPASQRDVALAAALQAASQTAREASGKPLGPNPRALLAPHHAHARAHLTPPLPAADATALPVGPDAVDTLQSMLQIAGKRGDGTPAAANPMPSYAGPALPASMAAGISSPTPTDAAAERLPPGPTPDLHSLEFADDMANQVSWLAERRIGNAQLRIHPDELGPVDIQLQVDGDYISVEFGSRHAETRQALEAGLPRLRELFEQQGLTLVQADVGQHAGKRDTTSTQTGSGSQPLAATVDEAPDAADPADTLHGDAAIGLLDTYA